MQVHDKTRTGGTFIITENIDDGHWLACSIIVGGISPDGLLVGRGAARGYWGYNTAAAAAGGSAGRNSAVGSSRSLRNSSVLNSIILDGLLRVFCEGIEPEIEQRPPNLRAKEMTSCRRFKIIPRFAYVRARPSRTTMSSRDERDGDIVSTS